jgi:hypothetical protein
MFCKSHISNVSLALIIALFAAIGLFSSDRNAAMATDEKPQHTGPALIELFTSQGCSSCPPADLLAHVLDDEGGMVIISRPVTYWDRLGWKDTLAREENTQLQQAYAARGLQGRNGIYTPQMVIDGQIGVIGSMEADVRNALRLRPTQTAAIRARQLPNGDVAVGLGGRASQGAELMLIGINSKKRVDISRGENGGRHLRYTNVLRDEAVVARWSGGKKAIRIDKAQLQISDANRFALILRVPNGGPVLASTWIS